jgi:ribosomal protein S27AE
MAVKRCPKCGSDTIMAKVIYGATVQSLEDGTFKIIQQGKKFEVEPVQCMRCKGLFDNGMADLVEMQVCKTCGKPSLDIDENGECDICRTMKVRPELANMSTDDLIRMVLQLEKKTSVAPAPVVTEEASVPSVETAMNPPVEETASVEEKEITNTAAEKVAAAQQAIAEAQTGESVEETPAPKKRRVTKKKTDETNSETEDTSVSETPVAEETPAPLNDVDPFSANTTGFDMFGQSAEAPAPSVPDMPMPMFEEEQAF